MNERTYRGLLVAGVCANVVFLMLALLDNATNGSKAAWPIFIGWAFVVLLIVILALVGNNVRVVREARTVQLVEPVTPKAVVAKVEAAKEAPAPVNLVKESSGIPFVYNGFTLYTREMTLKNGGKQQIYFFAKAEPKSGRLAAKPATHHVGVNERTGLPFLKKGKGADGEDLTPEAAEAYNPQCSALTEEGHQCRNSSRDGSKYCASHFGYHPPLIAKAAALREDTKPRVKGAPDTKPSVRKAAA